MPNLGMGELLIILVIAVMFFGAKRLPEAARSLGRSVNAFKDGLRSAAEAVKK